jgi:hypothetical protein
MLSVPVGLGEPWMSVGTGQDLAYKMSLDITPMSVRGIQPKLFQNAIPLRLSLIIKR